MHELSLAGGILRIVEDTAEREGFRRVQTLRLAVGVLACVDQHALRFALEAIAKGTLLEVLAPETVSCGDARLALGQAWIAAHSEVMSCA